MRKRIHVNQQVIARNRKYGQTNPPITIKTSRKNVYAANVEIHGPSVLMYRPEKPLSCGARLWIETTAVVLADGVEV